MAAFHAVIDANVLVAALLTSNNDSATVRVIDAMLRGCIKPLYNDEIIAEYVEVLGREKFHFTNARRGFFVNTIRQLGEKVDSIHSDEFFPDPKDIVFYEVALSKEDAYLVTGNIKHFPRTPIVVTPSEMMEILETELGRR